MREGVYETLREQLDQYSVGFPTTQSGVEMKILKKLFTEEEADMFLLMSMMLETPESVSQRTKRDPEAVAALLERMAEKGLIFRWRSGETVKYAAVPFVLGIYEYQLKAMDREFAQMFEDYLQQAFHKSILEYKPPLLQPIPIHRSVDVSHPIATYEDSREIVKGHDLIAVADCICQVQQDLIGQGCDKPREVCFTFGSAAQYYIDLGMGRRVTTQEALEILDRCEEAGLVTQPANMKNPSGMCNCCGDCCPILRVIKKYPRPAEMVSSNFYAVVDPEECVGCETCLERCQVEAVSMGSDDVAEIDLNRCIGCGLCVTTCSSEAITLKPKAEDQRSTPPEKGKELIMEMAQRRGKTLTPLVFDR